MNPKKHHWEFACPQPAVILGSVSSPSSLSMESATPALPQDISRHPKVR